MSQCKTCGEFIIWDNHKCQPKFFCWVAHIDGSNYMEQGDAWTVHAFDHEAAAVKFAEQWDWQDCEPLMLNASGFVCATSMDGETKTFMIEGEMVPSYHGREWTCVDGLRALHLAITYAVQDIEWQVERWRKDDVPYYDLYGVDVPIDWKRGDRIVLLRTLHKVSGKMEVADD